MICRQSGSRYTVEPTHRDIDLEQVVKQPVLVVLGPCDLHRHRLPVERKGLRESAGQGDGGGPEAVDLGPRAPLPGAVGPDVDLLPAGINDGSCPADQHSDDELSQRQAERREERPRCTSTHHNRSSESNSHDRTTDELHDDLGQFASSSSSR